MSFVCHAAGKGNPKPEIRNPKEGRNPKAESGEVSAENGLNRLSFFIRISGFGFLSTLRSAATEDGSDLGFRFSDFLPAPPLHTLHPMRLLARITCFCLASLFASPLVAATLPRADLDFLRDMTRDVVQASRVAPGSNGGGRWPITNSCGFTLITPGKDTYTAFWVRDFAMAVDSGFITAEELRNALLLICRAQNGAAELKLANGLHVPPWTIPDHINYDGKASFYPGSYSSGPDQGNGTCGRVPPIDDHYEFVHIAYTYWKNTGDVAFFATDVGGLTLFERLEKAFAAPTIDAKTGLAETTEADRAVGFGFCDAETHTGKLLFASLLRYRAAGEMAELCRATRHREQVRGFREAQKKIRASLATTFADPNGKDGWLLASTGISRQPDVWGTLYALDLDVLDRAHAAAARKTVADAVRRGTITFEGGVRHVPTDRDFSQSSAWERSIVPGNTYQNGGYWHTATGWLIAAL